MSIQEIFELEKRDKTNLYDIHFYLEGAFWRAYEWSAYLSRNFPCSLDEEERLKVLKKAVKEDENGCLQVGLRLPSFEKYFPNVADDESIFELEDKHIVIHAEKFFEDEDFSDYETILNGYKNSVKLSKNEKRKIKESKIYTDNTNLSVDSLIDEIVSYPIENKNLLECMQFLSYIKDKVNKIRKNK